MRVYLAESAGFCYGVSRAVRLAEEAAEKPGRTVMLGPVIHNEHVIAHLKELGAELVHSVDELPDGARVIIRSHGERRSVFERLAELGAEVVDSTCPNVSRIHHLVREAEEQGNIPVIIGNRSHPEVLAIAGHAEHPRIFESPEELESWAASFPEGERPAITLVSQTTNRKDLWESCVKIAKKEWTNAKIFDTICGATSKRQTEAAQIASSCGAMLIVGDEKSSNTRHLAEVCQAVCPVVLLVQDASGLDRAALAGADSLGVTAGASTPAWIIKEVYDKMSNEINVGAESFEELLEQSIRTLNMGDKVTGIITAITPTEINVDLGTKHACYIPMHELTDDPSVKVEEQYKVGDEIEAFVTRINDVEGVATLSKKRLDTVKSWEDVEAACENGTPVEGIVTEENKGGIVASVKGVRVFVPASQTGVPKDGDLAVLLKTKVKLKITEVNRSRRRVVGSIRAAGAEERRAQAEKVWAEIEAGKRYTGTVKSMTSYGAFVDIGGVDGMVHISELTWSRIKHPSEVVAIGDQVEVYVIAADAEKKKISLGMKDRSVDPWSKFVDTYAVGSVATVKVVKLMTFGAFAEIVPGVDGLIHISQIAARRIEKPEDVLSEGQQVDVKITEIDEEHKKVSLSIRALLTPEVFADVEAEEAPVEE